MFRAAPLSLAALVIAGMTASPASASWIVGGTTLGQGSKASLATTASVDSPWTLKIAGSPTVKVQCKGTALHGESPEIIGPVEGSAKSLTFESCETTEPTKCTLESQPTSIKTEPLKTIVSAGPNNSEGRLMLIPKTKAWIASLPFSSTNTCGFATKEPILGAVRLAAPNLQTEATHQTIEGLGSTENNDLKIGTHPVLLEGGKTLLQLASGAKFKFSSHFSVSSAPEVVLMTFPATFTITNIVKGPAKVNNITIAETELNSYEWDEEEREACIKQYAIGADCQITAIYRGVIGLVPRILTVTVEDESGQSSAAGTVGF
jgi:hypothetical protein